MIINIVDVTNLERNLYLTMQLLEFKKPMIVCLNMIDLVEKAGLSVDIKQLQETLGCPVIPISALKKTGLDILKKHIISEDKTDFISKININIDTLSFSIKEIVGEVIKRNPIDKYTFSDRIDKFLLHPFIGIPAFIFVIYLLFAFSITLSKPFIDFFDIFFGGIFVEGFRVLLEKFSLPFWIVTFLADGIGGGLQTISTFIPPIFFIFLFLSFLEDCGYMARVAFTMDKFMHWIGLSGKSIIPMIVGFGCTVPAIMATRTLENKQDRMMTIMLLPFFSCGAKIPVYIMFSVYFFPERAGLVIFLLYFTGIFLALITGQILKRITFKNKPADFVMELPNYRLPTFNGLFIHSWIRLKSFIWRAGKIIVFVIILLTMINAITIRKNIEQGEEETISHIVSQKIAPVFSPMGIDSDNWGAVVGLFAGLFAKEAIVGAFETLYIENKDEIDNYDSTMQNEHQKRFKNIHQVIAYLLFILIYSPCVAAVATAIKEAGTKFALVQVIYLTVLAWVVAVLYYNIAIISPLTPLWILISLVLLSGIFVMFSKINLM